MIWGAAIKTEPEMVVELFAMLQDEIRSAGMVDAEGCMTKRTARILMQHLKDRNPGSIYYDRENASEVSEKTSYASDAY